jgi:hypothetical protein
LNPVPGNICSIVNNYSIFLVSKIACNSSRFVTPAGALINRVTGYSSLRFELSLVLLFILPVSSVRRRDGTATQEVQDHGHLPHLNTILVVTFPTNVLPPPGCDRTGMSWLFGAAKDDLHVVDRALQAWLLLSWECLAIDHSGFC